MSSSRLLILSALVAALVATAASCGGKASAPAQSEPQAQPAAADPLAEDLARFCARTDTARPMSEWGPAAYAEATTPELRGVLDELKDTGGLAVARGQLEELAGKAGVGACAAVAGWPKA